MITVLKVMAVGADTLIHSVSDNEEMRQKSLGPQALSLSLFYGEVLWRLLWEKVFCGKTCP